MESPEVYSGLVTEALKKGKDTRKKRFRGDWGQV